MLDFIKSDFQRTVIALVGALVLSTTCIGAAIGPARAAEVSNPATAVSVQQVNA